MWGYIFDIFLFDAKFDYYSIIGSTMVILGSFLTMEGEGGERLEDEEEEEED